VSSLINVLQRRAESSVGQAGTRGKRLGAPALRMQERERHQPRQLVAVGHPQQAREVLRAVRSVPCRSEPLREEGSDHCPLKAYLLVCLGDGIAVVEAVAEQRPPQKREPLLVNHKAEKKVQVMGISEIVEAAHLLKCRPPRDNV